MFWPFKPNPPSKGPISLEEDPTPGPAPPPYSASALESGTPPGPSAASQLAALPRPLLRALATRVLPYLALWTLITSAFALLCALLAHWLVLGRRPLTAAHAIPPTLLGALLINSAILTAWGVFAIAHATREGRLIGWVSGEYPPPPGAPVLLLPPARDRVLDPDWSVRWEEERRVAREWDRDSRYQFALLRATAWSIVPAAGAAFALGVALLPRAVPDGFGSVDALKEVVWGMLVLVLAGALLALGAGAVIGFCVVIGDDD